MPDFEYAQAKVLSVARGGVRVRIPLSRADRPCAPSCPACGLCGSAGTDHLDLDVAARGVGMDVKPGDAVTVAYRRTKPARAAMALFLPPLTGLVLGLGLPGGDGVLLGALAGFALGWCATLALYRLFPAWLRAEARIVSRGAGG